ncbi:MAG: chromosome segregation protein SMC, partial [Thiohalocapsa sp.]
PLINAALSRLTEIERRQREVSLSARRWDEARKAAVEAAERLSAVDARLAREERRRHTLERIRRSLPALARRNLIRERLAALGDVPVLEDDFGRRREEALSRRRLAAEGRSKARARLSGLRADAAALEVSDELLAEADAIDALQDRLGGHRKAARDRPGLVERRRALLEQARQRFAGIRADLSLDAAETLRPMLGHRRRATELGARREALESAVGKARERHEEVAARLADRRAALEGLAPPVSYEVLQQAVDEARRAGDLDASVAETRAELVGHEEACRRDLDSLGLWGGALSDLMQAPLPGEPTLRRFADAFQAIDEDKRGLEDSIAEARREQRQTEEALLALRLAGEVPTEAELEDAREWRDRGWRLLKRQWIDGEDVTAEVRSYARDRRLPDVFEARIAAADDIADRLRRESHRVHDYAGAQATLEACRKRNADAEQGLQRVAARRSELEQSWRDAWKAADISPLSPGEMSAWLLKASLLREKALRGEDLRGKEQGLQRGREALRRGLVSALAVCGQAQPDGADDGRLRPLLDHAESRLRSLEQTAGRRTALEQAIAELGDAERGLGLEVARAESALGSWSSDWATLMGELGCSDRATPGEVSDLLEAIADGLKLVDEAAQLQLRIDGIDDDAATFAQQVETLVLRLAPGLAGRPVDEAALQLDARLTGQRQAKSRLDELNKQARQADAEIRDADAEIRAAEEVLGELCRQARCESPVDLEAVERRFREQRDLVLQLRDVETELVEGGDGLSVEALQIEAAEVDRDSVVTELTALGQRIEQELRPEREGLFEQRLGAERDLQAMAGTDQAAALAEQAQQTLSELRSHAERYVRLRLAARVLRDEIEGFRRRHRDPILTRASHYFGHLTCSSLTAVETDFDESDQPVLVGVRPGGERLRVEAMSTGTRDQLYLALRLATLDHYLESAEPLPFIVDDILIQFDDDRSRATLAALADFSDRTQVILFTHHERVVQEATALGNATPRVFVHELG